MEYNGYCVRVQAFDGYASKIKQLALVPDYQSIVAIKHKGGTGENPHYHLVVRTDVKDQAFRVRMKKVFDQGKGNAHMSIKNWDGALEAISYLFHEEPDGPLVIQHNVSNETIDKARELNKSVLKKVAEAKSRAAWRLEDAVYEDLIVKYQRHPKYMIATGEHIQDEIGKVIVLHALRHDKYVPNDYLLRAMVTKLRFRLLDGDPDTEERLADQIVARVFHRN